jgi:hypothetical protein
MEAMTFCKHFPDVAVTMICVVAGCVGVKTAEELGAFLKFRFGSRQLVAVAGDPDVQGWEKKDAEEQSSEQAADDDDGEGTLGV